MKETNNIEKLLTTVLAALKSIFNMEQQAMSVVCIKVQNQSIKSPHHYLHKK
jgi:hypothetical protein